MSNPFGLSPADEKRGKDDFAEAVEDLMGRKMRGSERNLSDKAWEQRESPAALAEKLGKK